MSLQEGRALGWQTGQPSATHICERGASLSCIPYRLQAPRLGERSAHLHLLHASFGSEEVGPLYAQPCLRAWILIYSGSQESDLFGEGLGVLLLQALQGLLVGLALRLYLHGHRLHLLPDSVGAVDAQRLIHLCMATNV